MLGKRPHREDGLARKLVERILCLTVKAVFGVSVPDANAPFRLMKAELVRKYINRLPENYNLPNVMLTTYFAYYHEQITFREITFRPRQGGRNFINMRRIVKIGCQAVKDFARFRRDMKNA